MSMIILPERLRAAGIHNQTPPVQYQKWTPFFRHPTDPQISVFAGMSGAYSGNIYKTAFGGISNSDILEKKSPYLTETDYINYLKTLQPWADVRTGDNAVNGRHYLNYTTYSLANGGNYGGYEGYAFFEKVIPFVGVSPGGNWTMTIQMYIYYRLVNPT